MRGIATIKFDRLGIRLQRFSKSSLSKIGIGQIHQNSAVRRLELERCLKLSFRVLKPALFTQNVSQIVMRFRVVRNNRESTTVTCRGLIKFVSLNMENPKIVFQIPCLRAFRQNAATVGFY